MLDVHGRLGRGHQGQRRREILGDGGPQLDARSHLDARRRRARRQRGAQRQQGVEVGRIAAGHVLSGDLGKVT
jgi:hypothetical protein